MKKILVLMLSLILVLGLGACSSTNTTGSGQTSTSEAQDGTYTATEKGFGGDVTVTLNVANGAFDSIKIEGASESEDYGQKAMPVLQDAMNEAKSPEVDAYSGATVTSKAALTAALAVFEEAKLSYNTKEESTGEDETAECDVLVIGLGASGTMAAVNAAEAGAKVIGVETTNGIGGMGNAAQGMFAVGSVLQQEKYGDNQTQDEEYWYEDLARQGNYLNNGQLVRTFVSEAKNTVSYLLDKDINVYLSPMPQQIAHFDMDIEYHRWDSSDAFTKLTSAMEENGVDMRMQTTAQSLIVDENGAVTGAVCKKADGGTLTITAKSTIVSTGSFAGDEELMKEVLGNSYDNTQVMIGSYAPGVNMMWEAGAAKGELLTMNHGIAPGVTVEEIDQLTLNTPILWVNNLGERFMNESLLKDTVEFSSAVMAQNGIAYTIVDQATVDRWTDLSQENTGTWVHYWDRFGIKDADGNPTIYHAPIDPEVWASDFATLEEANEGIVADSLAEVAEFIGCDEETLKETIDNYNGYVSSGKDDEFFKDSEDLVYSVSEGPYYVTRGHSVVLGALGGVNVTNKLEVVTDQNEIIPGLYATGNNCSGISVAAYVNVEGVGLGFSLTSGRLAGTNAANFALSK